MHNKLRSAVILCITFAVIAPPSITSSDEYRTAGQESSPKFIETIKNGQIVLSGLCADILKAVEEKEPSIKFIGYKVKYIELMPVPRMELMLKNGELDVVFCLIKDKIRQKKFIIPELELYSMNHVIAVRIDDDVHVSSFDDIRKMGKEGTLLTVYGTATADFLRKQDGLLIDDGGKTSEDNLNMILLGRARFFYYTDLAIKQALQSPKFKGKFKILPTVFHSRSQYMIFSKKVEPQKIRRVVKIVKQLKKEGVIKQIVDRYD